MTFNPLLGRCIGTLPENFSLTVRKFVRPTALRNGLLAPFRLPPVDSGRSPSHGFASNRRPSRARIARWNAHGAPGYAAAEAMAQERFRLRAGHLRERALRPNGHGAGDRGVCRLL